MNRKNAIMTTTLGLLAVISIASMPGLNNVFAEESSGYKVADNIQVVFTFTFKDGVEVHEFPVFNMDDDFVANNGSPSFSVEGIVGNAPHLYKALDEAFKYKANPSYEWSYQFFDIDVDFKRDGDVLRTLAYKDCYVDDYKVKTLTDDYESYLSSSSGFAIIDDIDFLCGGLNPFEETVNVTWHNPYTEIEYATTPYKFADDIRTFVIFEFDQGIEKIEFPYFVLTSGFAEESSNVIPEFSVEGTISKHPLLNQAIDNARKVSGYASGSNIDFEATVEFTKGDDVLRTLKYKDCRVSGAKMITQYDKEEGFTGKSGFAYVEEIDFECIGLATDKKSYLDLKGDAPSWSDAKISNVVDSPEYQMSSGLKAIASFTYDDGVEVIEFPIFVQGDVLVKSSPTFELEGAVGDFPMLYKRIDNNLSVTRTTGANNFIDLFNVDVELVNGDKVHRGFNYVDCRVTDYVVETQRDKEESYFKGFALSNTFEFTCQGYHANNPIYDYMMQNHDRAKTINSNDLRNTQTWHPNFTVQ